MGLPTPCTLRVQNLTLRSQKPGVLSSSPTGQPKSSSQAQSLALCPNKTAISTKGSQPDPAESNRKGESPTSESRSTPVTRTSSIHQLIAPASYSPIHPHSLIKHQQIPLHSPPPKISHHQLILQQQQQVQPIALQTPPKEELPAAEALVQLPFQTLPPPQTVAVNLQVQPPVPVEAPVIYQVENVCEEEMPDESECARMDRTPTPPTLSPPAIVLGNGEELASEEALSEQVGLPAVASSVSASVIKSPLDPSHTSIPPPPLLLPAATTRSNSTSMPNSIPSLENRPPQAIVKPQILTHVIEGFVIQEGLEPFPVSRSSLLVEQPVEKRLLMEGQVMSVVCVESELQNTKHADNSSDTEIEDMITEEGLDEIENELLKCEACGKMGYASKFLRSKRFCSLSCAKRHSGRCAKKYGLFSSDKSSRWNRKSDSQSLGQRGRRPTGPDGASREHFLRQLPITYPSAEDLASHEDAVPTAMTTRLRRQSERERERELRELRIRKLPENIDLLPAVQADPSVWTVDEVWAFIHSLPGCQDIADEFRAQEIDGQALLLLKEDHLMSAMNIKLGPALKICARINSLKES
ncbi:polyhomeotic-like protein 3 [Alligator mississippiensis]|uniref:Polyhomeotic-like protein 3 n=1 Tax=Alligator mississippiensis TaxID=8496 RepID=A0A151NC74_ALLMI|nr:polyhomeotic-like protein 3 [Alligator mississippiensis]